MDKIGILDIEQFRNKVNYLIGNSGLPVWAVYFVLKDVMSDVSDLYIKQLNNEIIEQNKKEDETPEEKEVPSPVQE